MIKVTATQELTNSLFVTGFPYDTWENPQNNLDHFGHFMLRSQGVRRLGSAALDLCYVAAGRFDGYWEIRLINRKFPIASDNGCWTVSR